MVKRAVVRMLFIGDLRLQAEPKISPLTRNVIPTRIRAMPLTRRLTAVAAAYRADGGPLSSQCQFFARKPKQGCPKIE